MKARGLNVSGNKNELAERLQAALSPKKSVSSTIDDLDVEAHLLNVSYEQGSQAVFFYGCFQDDDLEQENLVTSESVLTEIDAQLDAPVTKVEKRKAEPSSSSDVDSAAPKKIVLNRKSVTEDESSSGSTEKDATETKSDGEGTSAKKVVKLSELSAKEVSLIVYILVHCFRKEVPKLLD